MADALHQWIVQQRGVEFIFHYYITVAPSASDLCATNLRAIKQACHYLLWHGIRHSGIRDSSTSRQAKKAESRPWQNNLRIIGARFLLRIIQE